MKDGHIHTCFCPHGSDDTPEMYIKRAIEKGYDEISFTEHLFLPGGFEDPAPSKDSAPDEKAIIKYFDTIEKLKKDYKGIIKINTGLEVDYLEGLEYKTRDILDKYGERIDDAILSVHMLKIDEGYMCIDYSVEEFKKAANILGGVENLYNKYYETLKKSVESDLGKYKPKRIGHFNLVRRFCEKIPYDYSVHSDIIEDIIKIIKENGYELDYNVAGLRKEGCGEIYVDGCVKKLAEEYSIPMVLGSDSHTAETIDDYSKYI